MSRFLVKYLNTPFYHTLLKEMSASSNNVGNSRGRGKAWKREFVLGLANLVKDNWRSLGLGDGNLRNIPDCFNTYRVLI